MFFTWSSTYPVADELGTEHHLLCFFFNYPTISSISHLLLDTEFQLHSLRMKA
jgi:hypothetical protein